MKYIFALLAIVAAVISASLFSVSAHAAPPIAPQTATATVLASANDGYVMANTGSMYDLPPKVCPRPLFYYESQKACFRASSWDRTFTGKPSDPITPQQLLDDKFGPGKTSFVGISPARPDYDNAAVVIFYKVKEVKK
jgi:hypothetical protein